MNVVKYEDVALESYLRDIARTKPLSLKAELELFKRIKAGDESAIVELLNANLRFVVSVARNYQNQGLPLTDLINEGNLGLIKAVPRFNPELRHKFISYAVWWIRQTILSALAEQSRITAVPINVVQSIYRARKVTTRMEQKLGHRIRDDEVAKEMKVSESEVSDARTVDTPYASLDKKFSKESDGSLMDVLGSEDSAIEGDSELESTRLIIEKALGTLREREAEIIRMYYGIGYDVRYTLDEIGKKMNITRERVRQIKNGCLKRLKRRGHDLRAELI